VFVGLGLVAALMLPATVSAGLLDGTGISEPDSIEAAPATAPALERIVRHFGIQLGGAVHPIKWKAKYGGLRSRRRGSTAG
jgi:hypothetical protein